MEGGDGNLADGGDQSYHFHRNEAISAVADEGFLGDEDDDYEDLYNDVNIGEGFHQSLHRQDELRVQTSPRTDEVEEDDKKIQPSSPIHEAVTESNCNDNGSMVKIDAPKAFFEPVQRSEHPGDGIAVKLGEPLNKPPEIQGQVANPLPPPPLQVVESGKNSTKSCENQGQFGNRNSQGFGRNGGFNGFSSGDRANSGGVGTVLFVGELHWWTTDAQLESELSKYGAVKELKFFDEKASGKSKGYCQVEFYDHAAAAACKERMNGHEFNGRPCVVAFASPHNIRRMGEAQLNKNQANSTFQRRATDVGGGRGNNTPASGNHQNFGRGSGSGNGGGTGWGRGAGNRGPIGQMRSRVGMGGRGIIGNGGFGPAGASPLLLPPQAMMGQGFDPMGYGAMGRMGGYGSFPAAPMPPFSAGALPTFPGIGGVGLPGVAPHVNPAFFGRGMPPNGMGMMPVTGAEGQGLGMWSDPSVGGWGGDEQVGRTGDSSCGDDAASEHHHGDGSRDRGGWSNSAKEKDRAMERDISGISDRRHRDERGHSWDRDAGKEKHTGLGHDWSERRNHDDREAAWDRERGRDRDRDHYRNDRDRYSDHNRHRDRKNDHVDEWDRGQSSRMHSKSRMPHEEEQRQRSRDIEHGKRRRLPSE